MLRNGFVHLDSHVPTGSSHMDKSKNIHRSSCCKASIGTLNPHYKASKAMLSSLGQFSQAVRQLLPLAEESCPYKKTAGEL